LGEVSSGDRHGSTIDLDQKVSPRPVFQFDRGYTRVPSLVSTWSTAPFLLNKRLGPFDENPSVESRTKSFQASIEQLLWPEKRVRDYILGDKLDGFIVRTMERSWVSIPKRNIPVELSSVFGSLPEQFSGLLKEPIASLFDKDGNFVLGPIPKGFPINLLASYRPLVDVDDAAGKVEYEKNFLSLLVKAVEVLPPPGASASDEEIFAWVKKLGEPLLKLSKCPDFVVNRGHYFGTAQFNETDGLSEDEKSFGSEPVLSDDDKRALIEPQDLLTMPPTSTSSRSFPSATSSPLSRGFCCWLPLYVSDYKKRGAGGIIGLGLTAPGPCPGGNVPHDRGQGQRDVARRANASPAARLVVAAFENLVIALVSGS